MDTSHHYEVAEMDQLTNNSLQDSHVAVQNTDHPLRNSSISSVHSSRSYRYHAESISSTSMGLSRRSRWVRITIFILLEICFTALAGYCASRPLILPSNLIPSTWQGEVKGGFTILFIVWQTLALFPVRDILSYVFAGEWFYQFSRTGILVPGTTDRVSTLTAGQWDRVRYYRDRQASWSFRTAFITSWVFIALAALAPGAMSVVVVFAPHTMMLEIGNLTIPDLNVFDFHFLTQNVIERAWLITRLEQIEKSTFGYQNQRNWLVAWPPLGLPTNGSGSIEYPSDVVRFEFNCQWEVPTWDTSTQHYGIRGLNWSVWDLIGGPGPTVALATIMPMAQWSSHANSLSAYLFLGGNGSLAPDGSFSSYSLVDLTGLPSAYNLTGNLPPPGSSGSSYHAPLTTVLVCDPQLSLSGGKVTLNTNGSLFVTNFGLPSSINNIPREMAYVVLSQGLLGATSVQEFSNTPHMTVNYIAASLFLKDPSFNLTLYPTGVPVLDLVSINHNLDVYAGSASKAYMDGYLPNDTWLPTPALSTIPVEAQWQEQRLALVTNNVLWGVVVACTVVAGGLLVLLGVGVGKGVGETEPLGLGSVIKAVQVCRTQDDETGA